MTEYEELEGLPDYKLINLIKSRDKAIKYLAVISTVQSVAIVILILLYKLGKLKFIW